MPFIYHTKHVQPDDNLLIQSKQNCSIIHLLSCVDCYYVVINLKHNRMCNLKKPYIPCMICQENEACHRTKKFEAWECSFVSPYSGAATLPHLV